MAAQTLCRCTVLPQVTAMFLSVLRGGLSLLAGECATASMYLSPLINQKVRLCGGTKVHFEMSMSCSGPLFTLKYSRFGGFARKKEASPRASGSDNGRATGARPGCRRLLRDVVSHRLKFEVCQDVSVAGLQPASTCCTASD